MLSDIRAGQQNQVSLVHSCNKDKSYANPLCRECLCSKNTRVFKIKLNMFIRPALQYKDSRSTTAAVQHRAGDGYWNIVPTSIKSVFTGPNRNRFQCLLPIQPKCTRVKLTLHWRFTALRFSLLLFLKHTHKKDNEYLKDTKQSFRKAVHQCFSHGVT